VGRCNELREGHVGIETASKNNLARLVFGGRCDGFDVLTTIFAFEEHYVVCGRNRLGGNFLSERTNKGRYPW